MLWALADFYDFTTNMVAESTALLQGLQLCVERRYLAVDIEVDTLYSLQIIKMMVPTPRVIYPMR